MINFLLASLSIALLAMSLIGVAIVIDIIRDWRRR